MFVLATVLVLVVGTICAQQPNCTDQIDACRADHWLPFEMDPLPQERCEASRALGQCLAGLDYSCSGDAQRENLVRQAKTCYITANSPCEDERARCRDSHEADLDSDPVRACSRAVAWVSCLRDPDVVFFCGMDLPDDVQNIWYDRCYKL